MKNSPPAELREHAIKIGSDEDLVQISGGNVSVKIGKEIWIKASGKKLSDANDENIFCHLRLNDFTSSNLSAIEDFSTSVIGDLLPSIETNFHILLPFKYVTHLHSLGSIAFGILDQDLVNCESEALTYDYSFVEYAKPGSELAVKLEESDSLESKIVFLQNHGVIFSDDNLQKLENRIQVVETDIREFLNSLTKDDTFPNWIDILTRGVLTPDEAVFLGATPFLKSETILESSIAINSLGELLFPRSFSLDKIKMAHFYKRVACLIEKKTFVHYIPPREVDKVLTWDKERRRIEMSE